MKRKEERERGIKEGGEGERKTKLKRKRGKGEKQRGKAREPDFGKPLLSGHGTCLDAPRLTLPGQKTCGHQGDRN